MVSVLNILFLVGLVAMLPAYVMYFVALDHFGRSLRSAHPEIYAQVAPVRGSSFARNYGALNALRSNPALAAQLEPSVAAELRSTYRYLVVGLGCFMVVLFTFLGSSVIAKA